MSYVHLCFIPWVLDIALSQAIRAHGTLSFEFKLCRSHNDLAFS